MANPASIPASAAAGKACAHRIVEEARGKERPEPVATAADGICGWVGSEEESGIGIGGSATVTRIWGAPHCWQKGTPSSTG